MKNINYLILIIPNLLYSQKEVIFENDSIKKIIFHQQIDDLRTAWSCVQNSKDFIVNQEFHSVACELSLALREDSLSLQFCKMAYIQDTNSSKSIKELAQSYHNNQNIVEAKNLLVKYINEDSLAVNERIILINWLTEEKKYDSALAVVRSRPEILCKHFRLQSAEAKLFYVKKAYYASTPILKDLHQRRPKDEQIRDLYFKSLFKSNRVDSFVEVVEPYFWSYPSHSLAFMLGLAHHRLNNFDKSLEWIEIAAELSIAPEIGTYHNYAGLMAEKKQDLKKSEHHYLEALRYDPENGYNYYFLAIVQDALGKHPSALRNFSKFLSLPEAFENQEFGQFAKERLAEDKRARFFKGQIADSL